MSRSARARVAVAAAAVVASCSALVGGLGSAVAADGGSWSQLSAGPGVNISNQPSVARFGRQLVVSWRQVSGTGEAIRTRVVGANARPVGPVANVATWASLTDPAAYLLAGRPTVAFAGFRTLDTTDAYNGPVVQAQSATAASWALQPGSLTRTTAVAAVSAVDDGTGQPLVAVAGDNSDIVTVHHGVDPAVPAASSDTATKDTGEAQDVALALDRVTRVGYALWYSSSYDANSGIHAEQVWPLVRGYQHAPLSAVPYGGQLVSANPGQQIAVTGRAGGGVWAAYASGYPSARRLVLWQVGSTKTLTLNRPAGIQYVGISAAPGGRLWVWWVEGSSVYATRTNPAVTRFGVIRTVAAPGGARGQSPTRTAGDGALGPLDLVVTGQPASVPGIFSTRIAEQLAVTALPASLTFAKGGVVVVTVSDAGVPVAGATVRVGALVQKTNAAGRAAFAVARTSRKGTYPVTASAVGFFSAETRYTVR